MTTSTCMITKIFLHKFNEITRKRKCCGIEICVCYPQSMERLTRDLMGIVCNYFSTYISIFHACQLEFYICIQFVLRFTYKMQFDDPAFLFCTLFLICINKQQQVLYLHYKIIGREILLCICERRKLKLKGINDSTLNKFYYIIVKQKFSVDIY